jgi:AcrR family transcriptional regulator
MLTILANLTNMSIQISDIFLGDYVQHEDVKTKADLPRYNLLFTGQDMHEGIVELENHRTRVGIARREKTRTLIMKNAIGVFAKKGPDLPVVDDFVAAAGVSRGTFYNYFNTSGELLAALTGEMSDEALGVVDPQVLKFSDPATRMCIGTRLYVQVACRYPLWGRFLTRIGSNHAVRGKLLDTYLTRDVELGIASGRIKVGSALVVRDMILGSIFFGIETILTEAGGSSKGHIEEMMFLVLHGIGLSDEEARQIAFMPLPEIGPVDGPIFKDLNL